jgi:S1-C subfamily serine protease
MRDVPPRIRRRGAAVVALTGLAALAAAAAWAGPVDPRVLDAEAKRVAVVAKVKPSVVAVFAHGGAGGGSGVLISDDGYALTNFHVVEGAGNVMQCGLPDGVLYDAVLVGLDKVGDVALIKLLPKKEGDKFPFAPLGDSDKVKGGDWSFAMGNPFLLATDFTPTVTYGLVSGVHRYQYPAGTLLEYTDCIQIDTSINPGNSGGPLFNADGELIGINGRGSFEKRGRVNSGVGYAISINQIKNFMGQLRAGLDTDHASLGALLTSESEDGPVAKMVVQNILDCDARRRGLDVGDQLVSFAGRPMAGASVNQYKNVLGLFPKGWRVPIVYRHEADGKSEKREVLVRLMGVQRQELPGQGGPGGQPQPQPQPQPRPQAPVDSPANKLFEAKPGFANYYFNKLERDRLQATFHKSQGDFTAYQGDWTVRAKGTVGGKPASALLVVKDRGARDGKSPLVGGSFAGVDFSLEPLDTGQSENAFKDPPGSGGLLMALYNYRQFLAYGAKGGWKEFAHGGTEPFYPPPADPAAKPDYAKQRVDAEVIRTELMGHTGKWYFSPKDHALLGFELTVDRDDDPCEVYFGDYRKTGPGLLPHRIEVRYGDKVYAVLEVQDYKLQPAGK